MTEKIFVTGASGYIGGAVAAILVKSGYQVTGLTRSKSTGEELERRGVHSIIGELSDSALLSKCSKEADVVINAANSDNIGAVEAVIAALKGTKKTFIHTSGSSIVSDQANGEASDATFSDDTKFTPDPGKVARVAIDTLIVNSGKEGIRSIVICPCMIYGKGAGINSESQQVPNLIKNAIAGGVVQRVGRGLNTWSTVHIDDLANLYLLALKKAPEGGVFWFAESGEVTFKDLTEKIKECLSIAEPVQNLSIEQATKLWGAGSAIYALGSNSRIRGTGSRASGWKPTHTSVLEDVPRCCAHFQNK